MYPYILPDFDENYTGLGLEGGMACVKFDSTHTTGRRDKKEKLLPPQEKSALRY
jgi:hypothetical protein